MKSIMFSLHKWMQVLFVASCVVPLGANAAAQLSDLRHSRQPLPGVSEISRVGISVELGKAQQFINPASLIEILQPRMESLGYRIALPSTHSPDGLWLQFDCQALSAKKGFRPPGAANFASSNASESGPPCQLTYTYQQEVIPWKNVERLIYSQSVATMKQLGLSSQSLKPQECLKQFFNLYDFPVLLAAEWGHVDRLLQILNRPNTSISRQRLILTLLGETQQARGYLILVEKLQDGPVAQEAAEALGFFGLRAQSHLLPLVQDRSNPELQAAAAKGLGRIAAATGNSQHTPLFMRLVADSTLDIRVRTQLAWALGKAPDMRSYSTLLKLEQHIWNDHSQDPDLQEFREAVDWSIREVKQGGHGDDF